ncbi:MAG: hypothetical protein Ct9H300mP12_09470 [Acidimicrobiales bacterium]|nr:MAG: hypothetical protein Ct9H300mP12_09470 [Acidimicrobiales bacterium]
MPTGSGSTPPVHAPLGGDYQTHIREYRRASEASWAWANDHPAASTTTIRYGDDDAHAIDVMALIGDRPAPLLAFIHGGYWQELSRVESRFPAPDLHPPEAGTTRPSTTPWLPPLHSTGSSTSAARPFANPRAPRAQTLGLDPNRIVLAGHSAGAHLAAMVAADPDGTPCRRARAWCRGSMNWNR